jgi:glycerol-3-phosphate acyltransferase PlsX
MRIAVDAMGGDYAPEAVVTGAVRSCAEPGHEVVLVGRRQAIDACLAGLSVPPRRVQVREAEAVVGMGESPAAALKRRDTSLAVAVGLVRDGEAEAVVSAGNSGAFMGYATLRLETVDGVERPAIAICLPAPDGLRIVLDAGANANCRPSHLVQFARMGVVYAREVIGVQNPAVGLLSIGEEATKGSGLTKAAHKLLSEVGDEINFVGNIEGHAAFTGSVDVIVCDGFTGNVFLKTAEGTAAALVSILRQALSANLRARIGAALIRPAFRDFLQRFDYATVGGALLLGVRGICVVGHGRSDARAIAGAITVAKKAVEARVVQHIADSCKASAAPATAEEAVPSR